MLARMMGFASLALGLALSGCGGSSGTGTPKVFSPPSLNDVDLKMTARPAARAAMSKPSPGSVTQSSNIDSNTGATTDRVRVEFNNDTFRVMQEVGETWEIRTGNAEPLDEELGAQDVVGLVSQEENGQRILIAYTRAPEGGARIGWPSESGPSSPTVNSPMTTNSALLRTALPFPRQVSKL